MLHIDPRDPTPIPAQIERSLRAALAEGLLQAGDPLPTVRQLAVSLRVNANVLSRAYQEMERAGLVEIRAGLGAFVTGAAGGGASPAGSVPGRYTRLCELEDRFLAEAASLGFSLDEVIIHLDSRRTAES